MDRWGLTVRRKQGERCQGNHLTWKYGKLDDLGPFSARSMTEGGLGERGQLGWVDRQTDGRPSFAGKLKGNSGSVGGLEDEQTPTVLPSPHMEAQ